MGDINYIVFELLRVWADVIVWVCAHTHPGRVGLHRIGFSSPPQDLPACRSENQIIGLLATQRLVLSPARFPELS